MEYLDGEALSDRLERQGIVQPREAARIVQQVALTLTAAHARGLVHRDIKPSNILLERGSGRAKVTDFGLARLIEGTGAPTSQSGGIVGTPAYMSPEQVTAPQHLDGRSDLHSLGVVLYELLTGERPFRGMTHLLLEQVVHDEPRPPRKLNDRIPRDLETITLKCLVKEPGRRYPSAAELADELQRWLEGKPIHARPVAQGERLWRWCRRNPVIASLTAALLLLFVAGFAGVSWNYWQAEAARGGLEASLYLHRISLAHRELTANLANPARAEQLLEACPPDRRGWEWRYLKRLWRVEPVVLRDPANEEINSIAFSSDGDHVAAACRDATVKVWDLKTGQVVILRGHEKHVFSVAFRRDGRRLASASNDWTVKVWDVTPAFAPARGWRAGLPVLGFWPQGGSTATVCLSAVFQLQLASWMERKSPQPVLTLPGSDAGFWGVAFSPDGQRLAAVSGDGQLTLWDAETGQRIRSVPGQFSGQGLSVAFSPDGRWVASAAEDCTVKLWDAATLEWNHTFRGHTAVVRGLAFSRDGRRLVSGSQDRTVKVWDLTRLKVNQQSQLSSNLSDHPVFHAKGSQ